MGGTSVRREEGREEATRTSEYAEEGRVGAGEGDDTSTAHEVEFAAEHLDDWINRFLFRGWRWSGENAGLERPPSEDGGSRALEMFGRVSQGRCDLEVKFAEAFEHLSAGELEDIR